MLEIADLPPRKRRRITGKSPPLLESTGNPPRAPVSPEGPTVVITESESVRALSQIRMTGFPTGALGLAPISQSAGPLKTVLERKIGEGQPFKLKVDVGWEAKKAMAGEDSDLFKYTRLLYKCSGTSSGLLGRIQKRTLQK